MTGRVVMGSFGWVGTTACRAYCTVSDVRVLFLNPVVSIRTTTQWSPTGPTTRGLHRARRGPGHRSDVVGAVGLGLVSDRQGRRGRAWSRAPRIQSEAPQGASVIITPLCTRRDVFAVRRGMTDSRAPAAWAHRRTRLDRRDFPMGVGAERRPCPQLSMISAGLSDASRLPSQRAFVSSGVWRQRPTRPCSKTHERRVWVR